MKFQCIFFMEFNIEIHDKYLHKLFLNNKTKFRPKKHYRVLWEPLPQFDHIVNAPGWSRRRRRILSRIPPANQILWSRATWIQASVASWTFYRSILSLTAILLQGQENSVHDFLQNTIVSTVRIITTLCLPVSSVAGGPCRFSSLVWYPWRAYSRSSGSKFAGFNPATTLAHWWLDWDLIRCIMIFFKDTHYQISLWRIMKFKMSDKKTKRALWKFVFLHFLDFIRFAFWISYVHLPACTQMNA